MSTKANKKKSYVPLFQSIPKRVCKQCNEVLPMNECASNIVNGKKYYRHKCVNCFKKKKSVYNHVAYIRRTFFEREQEDERNQEEQIKNYENKVILKERPIRDEDDDDDSDSDID